MYFENSVKYYTTNKGSDNNSYFTLWQSRGKSSLKITSPISLTHEFSLKIILVSYNPIIVFNKSYLKTDTTFVNKLNPLVSIYFILQLIPNNLDTTITLASSLFGMMSYTKNGNTNPNEYTYSDHGVSFSSKKYTHSDGKDCHDLIIFGVVTSDSNHAENMKNIILVLGKNTLKTKNTTIQTGVKLKTNCCKGKCVLSIHYNFVNNLSVEIG